MELNEKNTEIWNIYLLVRDQIRITPTGEIIGLDHAAALGVIELYTNANEVKYVFESILECFCIERELIK